MARGQQVEQPQEQDFLKTEALKIGYNKMISDLDDMLKTDGITDLQKSLLTSQKNEIKKRLEK